VTFWYVINVNGKSLGVTPENYKMINVGDKVIYHLHLFSKHEVIKK